MGDTAQTKANKSLRAAAQERSRARLPGGVPPPAACDAAAYRGLRSCPVLTTLAVFLQLSRGSGPRPHVLEQLAQEAGSLAALPGLGALPARLRQNYQSCR